MKNSIIFFFFGIACCRTQEEHSINDEFSKTGIFYFRPRQTIYDVNLTYGKFEKKMNLDAHGWIQSVSIQEKTIILNSLVNYTNAHLITLNASDFKVQKKFVLESHRLIDFEVSQTLQVAYSLCTLSDDDSSKVWFIGIDLNTGFLTKRLPIKTQFDSLYKQYQNPGFLSLSLDGKWAAYVEENWTGFGKKMSFFLIDLQSDSIVPFFTNSGLLLRPVFSNDNQNLYVLSFENKLIFKVDLEKKQMSKVVYPFDFTSNFSLLPIPNSGNMLFHHSSNNGSDTKIVAFDSNGGMQDSTTLPFLTSARSCFINDSIVCFIQRPTWFSFNGRGDKSIVGKLAPLNFIFFNTKKFELEKEISINVPMELYYSDKFFVPK